MYKTMDGNEAVSRVAYKFSDVCGIYPITPSSPMAEKIDTMSGNGVLNYFGNRVKIIEMQSEGGAIGLVHGALQGGCLASSFTASQGLLLMIPSLYKIAGECLPLVLHVAARSLSTHALSIFGDHQDVYACRQTGCCMLCSNNPEEAYYMAMVSHLASIKASLPFIHFFDGFRTSHEINKIKVIDEDIVKDMIDMDALSKIKSRAIHTDNPNTRGMAQNEDVYFQNMEVRNGMYNECFDIVSNYMNDINDRFGTNLLPMEYYGSDTASFVIVAMGSVCDTIKSTIDYLNDDSYGMVSVHLFRPFNMEYLKSILPSSVKNICVLDRTKESGSVGEPMYLDVCASLSDTSIKVIGGRYGLSSKNTTPSMIKGVFEFMSSDKAHHNFTVGICDDVTNLSIDYDKSFRIDSDNLEMLIYGYGSDGMVSTSKDIIRIVGDNTVKYVQGYFQYDSKKSGGVTRCHIRIGDSPIRKPYYIESPSVIVVTKDTYMYKYDILSNVRDNSILILNTDMDRDSLLESLPNKVKYMMYHKNIRLFIIDAYGLVNEMGLKNKISTCMEMCIFSVLNVMSIDSVRDIMKKSNEVRFKSKGNSVIEVNNNIVDKSLDYLYEIDIPDSYKDVSYEDKKYNSVFEMIDSLKGDDIPVSGFIGSFNGTFEPGTSRLDKRSIAEVVPCWISKNCIQCNQCSFVCPHGVIRPYLLENDTFYDDCIPSLFPRDKKYAIGISYEDCTGCGLCANTCPGKNGNKAIVMDKYDRDKYKEDKFIYLEDNNVNDSYKSPIMNVKNESFISPKFEFSGACQGCGEAAYLKNLTQMFGNNMVIANATGCSSIYGGSMPSTPYSIPWASSLFEDNAEYGLGILTGINVNRLKVKNYMENHLDSDKELFNKWLSNYDNYDICKEVENSIDYDKHKYLLEMKDYITPKSMWIVGGDGFSYDIGYGGIDHVLSRRDNINILVLDTEVYSNTGGQSSKSSNIGSIASFTSNGKDNYKKDLARIAMCYPHVYVACVNIGYDKEQYLKVLKEANSYNGPSLIIAYSPCIEHGIKNGMEHSLDNGYLASKCGYFLCFSYNPDNNKFTLYNKDVDFDMYEEFLMTQNRYANLKKINPDNYKELFESQKKWAIERYEYYMKMQ